jgi:hypothetical protein
MGFKSPSHSTLISSPVRHVGTPTSYQEPSLTFLSTFVFERRTLILPFIQRYSPFIHSLYNRYSEINTKVTKPRRGSINKQYSKLKLVRQEILRH